MIVSDLYFLNFIEVMEGRSLSYKDVDYTKFKLTAISSRKGGPYSYFIRVGHPSMTNTCNLVTAIKL